MKSASEASLIAEAERCDDCLCWVEHCESDCCTHLSFRLNPQSDVTYSRDTVKIRIRMTPDLQRYFELHGAQVEGDAVVLATGSCDISPERVWVTARCGALQDDFLCRLHPDGKPECCKDFTWESAQEGDYVIPPRCLFAYKLKAATARRS